MERERGREEKGDIKREDVLAVPNHAQGHTLAGGKYKNALSVCDLRCDPIPS